MDFGVPETTTVDLDLLRCDDSVMPRAVLDDERQKFYEGLYTEDGLNTLPPVAVFFDGEAYWVADGFHRVAAAHVLASEGQSVPMPVVLYRGSQRDAMVFAAGANAKHGKPLTGAEKRRAIRRLLRDTETTQWSARRIARYVGVSDHTVTSVRDELAERVSAQNAQDTPRYTLATVQYPSREPRTYQMEVYPAGPRKTWEGPYTEEQRAAKEAARVLAYRGGTEYPMATGNIGQRPPAAPPDVPVPPPAVLPPESPSAISPRGPDSTDRSGLTTEESLRTLHSAWRYANDAARRQFLAWATGRIVAEDAKRQGADTGKTKRNAAIIEKIFASTQDEGSAGVHH